MDVNSLKAIISKRFGENVTDIKPDVFRVEGKFHQKNFARYYFDCSNSFLDQEFNLLDYQKNLLSEDYYKSAGPLQWNFYLYFVTDSTDLSNEKKLFIESDKAFTRKLVTTEEELIKLIEVQTKLKSHPKTKVDTALLSVWKNKLKNNNLNGIYLTKDYPKINDVFQLFLDRQEFNEPVEQERIVAPNELQTDSVSKIEMENFRSFKTNRVVNFKKVNLIRGVNGTGKTSLLEGIELCICGQTIENASKKEILSRLEITYKNGLSDKYTPEDNKKFQARERTWYGNNTLRGNALSQGFHIYNFFDSDAAFRFSRESNSGETIQQIFSRIVLGEQTNLVFDRLERFNDKLNVEIKQIKNSLKEKTDEKLSYQGRLNEFDSSSLIITTLGEIIVALDDLKWKGTDLLLSDGISRAEFQTQIKKLSSFFEMVAGISWIESLTITRLNNDLRSLTELIHENDLFIMSFRDVFDRIDNTVRSREVVTRQIAIMEKSSKYFLEVDINEIVDLSRKINLASEQIGLIDRFIGLVSVVTEARQNSFKNTFNTLSENLKITEEEIKRLSTELSAIEKSVGTLNKLKTDLKRIGKEYIQLSDDHSHCPLCYTAFSNTEILEAIESVQDEISSASLINSLSSQLEINTKKLVSIKETLKKLDEFKKGVSQQRNIKFPNFEELKIEEIESQLIETRGNLTSQLKRLNEINDRFIDHNLSESELNNYNLQLKETGVDFQIGSIDKNTFSDRNKLLHESFEQLTRKETELRNDREQSEYKLVKLLSGYFNDLNITTKNINEYVEKAKSRQTKLIAAINSLDGIKNLVQIEDDAELLNKKEKADKVEELFATYQDIETKNKLRNEYLQKIDSLKQSIQSLGESNTLLTKAKEVLDEIITVNNRENYLKEFFMENKQAILDIFKSIHLPNEFDDILFESSDVIKLKVRATGELRDLSEVSTGQKSAFILSLFLSLNNNLQSGPPVMIFDDPIAYVDDINTLSFLDFLRDRILTTDKQVFFATANSKLANLFQQKFDFLGDELEVIKLEKTFAH